MLIGSVSGRLFFKPNNDGNAGRGFACSIECVGAQSQDSCSKPTTFIDSSSLWRLWRFFGAIFCSMRESRQASQNCWGARGGSPPVSLAGKHHYLISSNLIFNIVSNYRLSWCRQGGFGTVYRGIRFPLRAHLWRHSHFCRVDTDSRPLRRRPVFRRNFPRGRRGRPGRAWFRIANRNGKETADLPSGKVGQLWVEHCVTAKHFFPFLWRRIIVAEGRGENPGNDDYALIKLSRAINFTEEFDRIAPACLPTTGVEDYERVFFRKRQIEHFKSTKTVRIKKENYESLLI